MGSVQGSGLTRAQLSFTPGVQKLLSTSWTSFPPGVKGWRGHLKGEAVPKHWKLLWGLGGEQRVLFLQQLGGHKPLWRVWGESSPLCSAGTPLCSIWDPPVPIPCSGSAPGSLQDPIHGCSPQKVRPEGTRSAIKTGAPSEESSQNLIFMIILIIFLLQNEAEKLEMHK